MVTAVVENKSWVRLFDLRRDMDEPQVIDAEIRDGVQVGGANLWILFFAILVASVGLNVNSTAVIIGAMLISPLMGPIMGVGYGLGVQDAPLIRKALRNLLIFTLLSLLTSTLYFTLSPLDTRGSELLARTTPTLWDVLIAFFGGAAGMVAFTRKSISNVVPGVAIATALMPPLCTVGFGLAHRDWGMAGGALFLYCINSVFIAYATLLFTKALRLPTCAALGDAASHRRANLMMVLTVLAIIVPSVYLGYKYVRQQAFTEAVQQVVTQATEARPYFVLERRIDAEQRSVLLTLGGEAPPEDLGVQLSRRMDDLGHEGVRVLVRHSGGVERAGVDPGAIDSLRAQLRGDITEELFGHIDKLTRRNTELQARLDEASSRLALDAALAREIAAQLPQAQQVQVAQLAAAEADRARLLIVIDSVRALPAAELRRIERWLAVREPELDIQILTRRSTPAAAPNGR